MQKMNIAYVNFNSFPHGMASTNRTNMICRMLASQGHRVHVFCVHPDKHPERNGQFGDQGYLSFKDFRYSWGYTSGSRKRKGSKFKLLLQVGYSYLNAISQIVFARPRYDVVMIHASRTMKKVLFKLAATISGSVYINEEDESPFIYYKIKTKNGLKYRFLKAIERRLGRVFNGYVFMTRNLDRFYRELIARPLQSIVIPMTVEPERYEAVNPEPQNTIVYCGNFTGNKDGIPILIRAFALIAADFPEMKLLLLGASKDGTEEIEYRRLISDLGIDGRVEMPGYVGRDEIPAIQKSAKILALARPDSSRSAFGFPTKLGEYLLTGRPVVVTQVGEIPEYLTDGESALLADPDSADDFAVKLRAVLDDYPQALEIGARGKAVAMEHFDYRKQGEKLSRFLLALLRRV